MYIPDSVIHKFNPSSNTGRLSFYFSLKTSFTAIPINIKQKVCPILNIIPGDFKIKLLIRNPQLIISYPVL